VPRRGTGTSLRRPLGKGSPTASSYEVNQVLDKRISFTQKETQRKVNVEPNSLQKRVDSGERFPVPTETQRLPRREGLMSPRNALTNKHDPKTPLAAPKACSRHLFRRDSDPKPE